MKKTVLTTAMLFAFTVSHVFAQSVLEKYDSETIYLSTHYKYVKNGESHPIGFFGGNLKKEMAVSPNGVVEFSKFQKTRKWGTLLGTVSLLGIVSAAVINRDGDKDELSTSIVAGGLVVFGASAIIQIKSEKHLNKSVWLRNRDVLK